MQKYQEMLLLGDLHSKISQQQQQPLSKQSRYPAKAGDILLVHVGFVASNTGQLDKHKQWSSQRDLSLLHCSGRKIHHACDQQGDICCRQGARALVVVSSAVNGKLQRSSVLHQGQNQTLCRASASCSAMDISGDTEGFLFSRNSLTQTLELPSLEDFHFPVCCLSTACLD